jgi:hypothetical protein
MGWRGLPSSTPSKVVRGTLPRTPAYVDARSPMERTGSYGKPVSCDPDGNIVGLIDNSKGGMPDHRA